MGLLTWSNGDVIYLDAVAVIYSVENVQPYSELLHPLWQLASAGRIRLVGSELLLLETLVKPIRARDVFLERACRHARRFAAGLSAADYTILNDVALNQVLVDFGGLEATQRAIAAIQADGTCWCGPTVWQGRAAMRISVSSWATTEGDVERSLGAMVRVARPII